MALFVLTCIGMGALAILTLLRCSGAALCIGILIGVVLFLRGSALGGGLGSARRLGHSQADRLMRLGACFALTGIAAAAQADETRFGGPSRVLIGGGQAAVFILALWLARRTKPLT